MFGQRPVYGQQLWASSRFSFDVFQVWLHIQQARDQLLQRHPLCHELYVSAHKSVEEGGSNIDSKVFCIDLQWGNHPAHICCCCTYIEDALLAVCHVCTPTT